ncbi:hypothetical protein VL20_5552 [Microcystis panniformis FACHB-1757]|uniref:Uncharacterized protein n=1 Tax=Microcystis panniformis FACHB-1757 TaxID=1638788 RepID=A0A0K1S8Q8_9CHRO|nr:hypothetical protein VL20_5552 [Microcystis panniformis FACHB-1757]
MSHQINRLTRQKPNSLVIFWRKSQAFSLNPTLYTLFHFPSACHPVSRNNYSFPSRF